mgnify:CR=1 FL=1
MSAYKPLLLDLFCGAGGAAVGYARAGFELVGVDIAPQPHYPFEFHQADAMTFPLDGFDVIHASPPCQKFSQMQRVNTRSRRRNEHPDLLTPTRVRLVAWGGTFVIENVIGAPMDKTITLCGSMFGLRVRRHRHFESNIGMLRPRCQHQPNEVAVYGDHPEDAPIHRYSEYKAGHTRRAKDIEQARSAMDIDWMDWREITQAIPPAYTEFVGKQLLAGLHREGWPK